jgi:hypothetical protein
MVAHGYMTLQGSCGGGTKPPSGGGVLTINASAGGITPMESHDQWVWESSAALTVTYPNPRLVEKAAMARRARTTHSCTVEWEKLSGGAEMVRVRDGEGREVECGVTLDPVSAAMDLMHYIVPPGSKGL